MLQPQPPFQARISPTAEAIQQENLLCRPTMKSVIFRLPEQSPPNREEQQTRFRQLYSARIVSDDAEDDERPTDGLSKQMDQISPDFASPEASIKSVFFSPIEPVATPSSRSIHTSRDVFFTPELASPTLIDDIQSSQSILELQKLRAAFGSDYPSLSRRTEARIQDLIVNSPSSVLVGENLLTSPEIQSLSTSIVSLGLSLSMEEEELVRHQQNEQNGPPKHDSTSRWLLPTEIFGETLQGLPPDMSSTKPGGPSHQSDEHQTLIQSVEELRARNHKLQYELQQKVSTHTKSAQYAQDTERQLQSQIKRLQESLGAASHQSERERKFFMQVQENLNRRLKDAKERLQGASNERDSIIIRLRQVVSDDDGNANVDELIQKATTSMQEQEKANIELAKALEAAQEEIRAAKDSRHKSEQLLTVATKRSRKLELENKQLLSQVKALSSELNDTRDKFNEAIEAQKQRQLKQWQEQEKRYMDTIHELKKNIRDQENTVSMDLYRHAVAESKRQAEQCQYYQQRAKTTAARIQSLERLVLSHNRTKQKQPTKLIHSATTQTKATPKIPMEVPPPPTNKPLVVMKGKLTKVPPPPPPKTVQKNLALMDPSQGNTKGKDSNAVNTNNNVQKKQSLVGDVKMNCRRHPNIPKQVRFKISHSPSHRSKGRALREVTPPLPKNAPPEPLIRLQPSKENSWLTPSRSSSSKLRLSLVRAAGGRLKLQSMLREKRQPLKDAIAS